ncbi:MAG: protein kinase [Gemmatimonadaceae bacterium]|nr:protein kinase [Gemmatimonadaceae bacterium]
MANPVDRLAAALADRYRIERELGVGGMATVYLAEDLKHGRMVALKVLRPELSAAMGSERFPREIKTVAQFNHPHILSLYDSGEVEGFLYFVMPFVDGESLRDRLAREKQLPFGDAVRILREVVDALAYSHARGVVHRDIKPGNVLLSGRHAVVTDFGVAKAITAAGGDKTTTVGIAIGTPQYMAPEQAMGEANIDHRADIYAIGILGYEMLAGRPPFAATTAQGILAAHVIENPIDIRQTRPGTPPLLADAIMKCLEKNPANRWQTADELTSQLEAIGTTPGGGVTPTDTRPLQAATVAAKSKRRLLIGVAAGAIVLGGAIGVYVLSRNGSGRIQKIGVMPIEDISGKDSVFAAAMHDALTNALARANVTGVETRSTMMRYKSGSKTIRDVANELSLGGVVEATVFRAGDVMRINVQFTDPVTSRSLWSNTYEKNVNNVLAAQGEVVAQVAAGIDSVLAGPRKPGAGQ